MDEDDYHKSSMAKSLGRAPRGHGLYCHDLDITGSSPSFVDLVLLSWTLNHEY